MSNSLLYALLLFAVSGTAMQWINIAYLNGRINDLERSRLSLLAELSEKISTKHTENTDNDTIPEV